MKKATRQKLKGERLAIWAGSAYQPINFVLTARIQGQIHPDEFRKTLEKLQVKYPQLSMRVVRGTDGDFYLDFNKGTSLPVRIIERKKSSDWIAEVKTELIQGFDLFKDPPIRFVWLEGENISEILFASPHAMADGLSLAYVVRDFLNFLNAPEINIEPLPILPAMGEIIPDFSGKQLVVWLAKYKAAVAKLFINLIFSKGTQSKSEVNIKIPEYNLLAWELTPQQTFALIARCREENTTVHAALCAAFLRSFGEMYADGWNRKIQSPVNLRDKLAQPVGESFGLYINLVEFYVNCAPERDFWQVAREIKQGFIKHTQDQNTFKSMTEMLVIMDALALIVTPESASKFIKKDYDLSITNLGRLDFSVENDSPKLEALFGPAISGDPNDIVLGVITALNKMHLTLSFTGMKLNMSRAEQVKNDAMKWLANATGW